MTTATKALIACTTASLIAVTVHTAAYGANAWLWAAWAALAAITAGIVTADRRR